MKVRLVSQTSSLPDFTDKTITASQHGDQVSVFISQGNAHGGQIELTVSDALKFAAKLTELTRKVGV